MPKVTVVQVIYNSRPYIERVFSAIFSQTFKDFNVVAVISGNDDSGKELLREKFPQVEVIDPGYNIGFAAGHNLVFSAKGGSAFGGEKSEFFQLVNPDMIMEPEYIERMLKAFDDPKVGAATGKLYAVDREIISNFKFQISNKASNVLDTTGVTIGKSGRARDRGQHEADNGQYDKDLSVQAVSAAGAMYRREALKSVAVKDEGLKIKDEYFDEDFHSYWEDVDLSWRMANAGWKNIFVPSAIGYHGRGAGSSEHGYKDLIGFIRHHKNLPPRVRELNYQNHIFLYIKNTSYFYPQFFLRELFMLGYVLFFEIGTLKILPQMFKLLPKMWKKRKIIKELSSRNFSGL